MRSAPRKLLAVAAACALAATTGAAASADSVRSAAPSRASGAGPLDGMRILISNDDGIQAAKPNHSDGLGAYEMRRALCAAGADVVVMAPWQVQSGRGTAVTNHGVLTVRQRERMPAGYENDCAGAPSGAPVFGVCLADGPCGPDSPSATPADTVKLALRGGLAAKAGWSGAPDLVVTGINSGLNVSSSVNDSGTVGAAIAAIDTGVPAVAFSASANADMSAHPVENYRATAAFGAKFLAGLKEHRLLTDAFALKVDYPDISAGAQARPPVWTRVGSGAYAYHAYVQEGGGDSFGIALGDCASANPGSAECAEGRPDADSTAALGGAVSVTPVTSDRTYGSSVDGKKALKKTEQYVKKSAPRP
ncbi:5'/3'-nucleotidase SurE [Streptomyces sp. NPDC099050]|uniref:5'/3'-nucleotidase SurE n=1 Tax=Streptomyces sp. NPDC099050 TaxID=3366100 RepID=UPI00381F3268